MPLPGFRDAIRAFGSGGSVEQRGFDDEGRRLTAARSASALMDSRISRAIQDSQQADAAVALRNSFGPNPDERQLSILGKLAGELLSGNRAEGVAQQNEARRLQLENVTGGGDIDTDLQNLLTQIAGDKLLGPGNVRVEDQATADINKTNRAKDINGILRDAVSGEATFPNLINDIPLPQQADFEPLSQTSLDLLTVDPRTIDVKTGVEGNAIQRFLGTGDDIIEKLAIGDPRAQEALAAMDVDQRASIMEFLGPEFAQWRVAQFAVDKNVQDSSYAIGKFLSERGSSGAPVAPQGSPPSAAIQALLSNPAGLSGDFNAKYGQGAAESILQSQQ